MSKLDYAICVAASLGYLMIHQQDALGLVVFDQQIKKMLKPSSKRNHLNVILKELMHIQPSSPSHISTCLHEAAKRIKKKGMIMIFSDFIPQHSSSKKNPVEEELSEIRKALQHFRSQSQDVMVFHILDESEANFTFDGPMRFKDPESGLVIEAGPEIKENYLKIIQDYQQTLQEICAEEDSDFLSLHTGENFDRPLMSFLLKRKNKF